MKLYSSIEIIRVWFLVLIIAQHSAMRNIISETVGIKTLLSEFGARVDIFFLLCGFFLYLSLKSRPDIDFWSMFKRRCMRILPAILLFKFLCMLILGSNFGISFTSMLSNMFMLNKNIGIDVTTASHIIWYVDVMFWIYLAYLALFTIFAKKREAALFITAICSFLSMCVLFSYQGAGYTYKMATSFLDGGLLRGIAFMGMGILLGSIPYGERIKSKFGQILATAAEALSAVMVITYPWLWQSASKTMLLNYILWAAVFIFLMSREYGYLSRWLNKMTGVYHVSKYCYEIYVFQWFALLLGHKWFAPKSFPFLTLFGTLVIAFIMGIAVKELFEDRLLKRWLLGKK